MALDLDIFLKPSNKWDGEYLKAVTSALRQYQPENAEKIIQRYLSEQCQAELNLTNTYARRIFRAALLTVARDVERHLFGKDVTVMWASIASRDWACCDRNIDFSYERAKRKLRNAFAGKNFIGVIEPGYYPDERWKSGDKVGSLISFHAHIVVWDTSRSKLQRHQRDIGLRFWPVQEGDRKTGRLCHVKTLADLWGILRYSTKMPFQGYDRQVNEDGSIVQKPSELALIHHYRLFRFSCMHTVWDAWLAGGEGAQVLRDVRKEVRTILLGIELFRPGGTTRRGIKAQPAQVNVERDSHARADPADQVSNQPPSAKINARSRKPKGVAPQLTRGRK